MKKQALKIKERYLLAELFFSFLLLAAEIFLFGQALEGLRFYLIPGLAGGLCCSWSLRNKNILAPLRNMITIAVGAVFIWIFYDLINSSLFYKDVIMLFARGGFVLAVLLSFGAAIGFLAYVEVLSLPLFMCFPLFVNNYNAAHFILIAFCFISWAALLKLKFEQSFTLALERFSRQRYSILFGGGLILAVTLVSWLLFSLVPLRSIKDGGFLIHSGEEVNFSTKASEQKYYDLQENLQEKILAMLPEFDPNADKSEILGRLSSLVKEPADVMEVKKARQGLLDQLRRSGPGLEEKDLKEAILLLEQYVDEKIALNLRRSKENINNDLKSNPFSIRERFSVLVRANKIQYANSPQKVQSYAQEVKGIINKSAVSPAAKKEIKDSLSRFQEWKNLQFYSRQLRVFKKKVSSFSEQPRSKLDELIAAIEEINSPSGLDAAKGKARILKYTGGKDIADALSEADSIIDTASRIILSRAIAKAKEKLRSSGLPEQELQKKEEALDKINSMEEYQELERDLAGSKQDSARDIRGDSGQKGKKLASIEIIPEHSRIPLGEAKELLALGTYDDNSRQDLTGRAKWSSLDEEVVAVSEGKVTSLRIGEAKIYAEIEAIKSRPASVAVESPRLVSISLLPGDLAIPINGIAGLKAEGDFSNGERQDITLLATWKNADNRIVKITQGKLQGLGLGTTRVYAEYSGVKSPAVKIRVVITIVWLGLLLLKVILSSLFFLLLLFTVLYALTEEKRQRLKDAASTDLRRFIIALYENTRGLLFIFGPRSYEAMPPLSYAALMEERYYISDNLYFRMTQLFEEAKYSNHPIKAQDADRALADYNAFIRIMLSRQTKGRLILKYCLALLLRKPLYV